jgi:hypothetical protein
LSNYLPDFLSISHHFPEKTAPAVTSFQPVKFLPHA